MPGTPPPIGVVGVIQFDAGAIKDFGEVLVSDLVNDPQVISAVRAVESAATSEARVRAIAQLMETLE